MGKIFRMGYRKLFAPKKHQDPIVLQNEKSSKLLGLPTKNVNSKVAKLLGVPLLANEKAARTLGLDRSQSEEEGLKSRGSSAGRSRKGSKRVESSDLSE